MNLPTKALSIPSGRILPRAVASALILATALAATGSASAQEEAVVGANTASIMAATISALPSCLAYQVTGVCFFLLCTPFGCDIETSIKVQHSMPDVVVSTYNSSANHPWTDVGKGVATALKSAGDSMLGSLSDSSADTARESQEVVTFKSTDAIGNPVGAILGGNWNFEIPDFQELMSFPSKELPKIMQQWAMVPVDVTNNTLEGARSMAMNPSSMLGEIGNLPSMFGGLLGSFSSIGSFGVTAPGGGGAGGGANGGGAGSGAGGAGSGGGSGQPGTGQSSSYQQMLDQMYRAMEDAGASGGNGSGSGNAGMSSYICPGGSGMLSIQYHSDLDSLFWRGVIPLELLYPGSWVPGVGEVGNGLINTWGGGYPRTGELVQSHPRKSSAVLAHRTGSIIRQAAQPHLYKKLYPKGESNYVYFKAVVNPKWQPVYPNPEPTCISFGDNDSAALTSWGDYKTSSTDGYIWNLWHTYECCERQPGVFLFAVP